MAKEETLPRSEIEAIQLSKLKDTVRYIYDRVKPYRDRMDAAGVKPEDIRMAGGQKYIRGAVFDNVINGPGIEVIVMLVRQSFFQAKRACL